MRVRESFPFVEEILSVHQSALGGDFVAYRNHLRRVLNFHLALTGEEEPAEAVAIAAAFHDLAIWTDGTFDYLGPSIRLAQAWLDANGRGDLAPEVAALIHEHHKMLAYEGPFAASVETFRRADYVDVSLGLLRFGLPWRFVREVQAAHPDAGFHGRLVALTARQVLRTPLCPLPMFHR